MSSAPLVLVHFTPPSGLSVEPLLFLSEPDAKPTQVSLEFLSSLNRPVITHSFSLLVEWFRAAHLPLPGEVVDLEGAERLIVGRPRREFGKRELPWSLGPLLKKFIHEPLLDERVVKEAAAYQLGVPSSLRENEQVLLREVLAKSMERAWQDLSERLRAASEYERFRSVEVPVYNQMLRVQQRGFRVNRKERDRLLRKIESEIIGRQHELSIKRKIDIERARLDLTYLMRVLELPEAKGETFSSAREVIDEHRVSSPICGALHDLFRDRRNRGILLRLSTLESTTCYVVFESIGTVTARVLASDPQVQHLRKDFRGVISARPGMKLLYLDYAHFEPSIMASLSGDEKMLELCNANDFYEELSRQLLGSSSERRTAKHLFLAYSYGMSSERLDQMIGETTPCKVGSRTSLSALFPGLEEWKSARVAELETSGRIGTKLGNHRYREGEGGLTNSERRWAVNQVIQGTGSLILKRLILKIGTRLPEVGLLLPMHDALLLEVEEESATELTEEVQVIFEEVFEAICPGVNPKATSESFVKAVRVG